MRHRLTALTASIAMSLGGLTAPLLVAPAHARTTADEAVAAKGEEKPVRDLHDAIAEKPNRLVFHGRVDPGHGPVIVQKKACASSKCAWKIYQRVPTRGPKERWSVQIEAPRHGNWYWRGYVKAYGGYATSWTHVYRTYRTRL